MVPGPPGDQRDVTPAGLVEGDRVRLRFTDQGHRLLRRDVEVEPEVVVVVVGRAEGGAGVLLAVDLALELDLEAGVQLAGGKDLGGAAEEGVVGRYLLDLQPDGGQQLGADATPDLTVGLGLLRRADADLLAHAEGHEPHGVVGRLVPEAAVAGLVGHAPLQARARVQRVGLVAGRGQQVQASPAFLSTTIALCALVSPVNTSTEPMSWGNESR